MIFLLIVIGRMTCSNGLTLDKTRKMRYNIEVDKENNARRSRASAPIA